MNDCIEAPGSGTQSGYKTQKLVVGKGKQYSILQHRMAWELEHGPIPPGMHVMHTCDNRACVNMDHLVLGTHQDNMADRRAKGRGRNMYSDKTHCIRGHEYTEENTYHRPDRPIGKGRQCKICIRLRY